MKAGIYFFSLIFVLTLFSCKENKYEVDVEHIEADISIKRLDKDLFRFSKKNAAEDIADFEKKYGDFFAVYNKKILKIGGSNTADYALRLLDFINYCSKEHIQDSVWAKYPELTKLEADLSQAFKHYKYYFPENKMPEIISFISAFNESVVTVGKYTGIALDKYLGKNSVFYERLMTEKYLRRRMIPEAIVPDVMRARAKADFPYESSSDDMLDNMIYEGKLQYYLNCMLPQTPDTIKWRYTQKQLAWAYRHEKKVWNYMVDNKKLFIHDRIQIRQYVGDAPFTTPFTDVSAPRIGSFIGFRIIEAYMEQKPEVSLLQLMQEKDSKYILSESKYNPE